MTEQKMKKCNNCGADIPENAIYCDICGELASESLAKKIERKKSKSRGRKRGYARKVKSFIATVAKVVGIIFVFLIILSTIVSRIENRKYKAYEKRRDLSDWEVTATPEACEKLDIGMTYEEVKEILGGDGKMIEDGKYYIEYYWPGEYYVPTYQGYLDLDFSKNNSGEYKGVPTLSTIRESEIQDGAECFETYNIIREDHDYSKIDTPIVTKGQVSKITEGMSYEKVCEILGSEGKLYRSSSWRIASNDQIRKTYVWRCKHNERDDYFELQFENGIIKNLWDWRLDDVD